MKASELIDMQDKQTTLRWVAMLFVCCTIYFSQLLFGGYVSVLSNWFVPDGCTLFGVLKGLEPSFSWSAIAPRKGIYFLHVQPYRWLGNPGFFVVNLAIAAWIVFRYGSALLLLFPFFLFSLPLPSKDLSVLLLVLAWCFALYRGSYAMVVASLAGMYFFRDGDFFISFACTVAVVAWRLGMHWRLIALGSLAIGAWSFVFGKKLLSSISVYADYVSVYAAVSSLGCCSFNDYFIRLVGNASNIALRAMFIDELGGVSIMAVVGFISGFSMLLAFSFSAHAFIRNVAARKEVAFASIILIVALAVLSVNPLVQPRYLLPYAASFFMISKGQFFATEKSTAIIVTVLVTVMGMVLYEVLPISTPPVPPVQQFILF